MHAPGGVVPLTIGSVSPSLRSLHERYGVGSSAFITAWNPASVPLAQDENDRRQAELKLAVEAAGYALLPGIGEDPSGHWPGERSTLVLGISREDAIALGVRFGQIAIVWSDVDAVPVLVLCGGASA